MTGQYFDCDHAVKPRVSSTVHFAHAASAECRLNFVWTEFRARGEGHRCAPLYPERERFTVIFSTQQATRGTSQLGSDERIMSDSRAIGLVSQGPVSESYPSSLPRRVAMTLRSSSVVTSPRT